MGFFDRSEADYFRLYWYELTAKLYNYQLIVDPHWQTIGKYHVIYERDGKKYIVPCETVGKARSLALHIQSTGLAKSVVQSRVETGDPRALIDAVVSKAVTEAASVKSGR